MSSYISSELIVQDGCKTLLPMAKTQLATWDKRMVGQRIAQLRQALGLKQAKLASRIGITAQKLNNYERGRHMLPYRHASELCNVTGATFDYLWRDITRNLPDDVQDKLAKVRSRAA